MNNMRRDRIKNSLQEDLHSSCEAGNPPTTLLLGEDDLLKKIREPKLSSHLLSQLPRYTGYQNQKGAAKKIKYFLSQGNKHIVHNTKTTDNTGINKYN